MNTIIYKLLPTKKITSKLDDKKSINIPWNSRLFFQIGLIISLLLVYLVIESTSNLSISYVQPESDYLLEEVSLANYVLEEPKKEMVKQKVTKPVKKFPKQQVVSQFKPVDNSFNKQETEVSSTETSPDTTIPEKGKTTIEVVKPDITKNISSVEFAPVFPGCENTVTKQERINCFSDKIRKFVSRKFNADKSSGNLTGEQRIPIQFTVDEKGNIIDVLVFTKDKGLVKEAKRVLSKLPKMTPGKQGDVPVKVQYVLPLVIVVNN